MSQDHGTAAVEEEGGQFALGCTPQVVVNRGMSLGVTHMGSGNQFIRKR